MATGTGPALAQDEGWRFRITPYVWLPTMDTSASVGGDPEAETSTSVLEILDFGALVTGEARKGRFTILGEFNYLDLGDDATGPRGLISADIDLKGVLAALTVRVPGLSGQAFR